MCGMPPDQRCSARWLDLKTARSWRGVSPCYFPCTYHISSLPLVAGCVGRRAAAGGTLFVPLSGGSMAGCRKLGGRLVLTFQKLLLVGRHLDGARSGWTMPQQTPCRPFGCNGKRGLSRTMCFYVAEAHRWGVGFRTINEVGGRPNMEFAGWGPGLYNLHDLLGCQWAAHSSVGSYVAPDISMMITASACHCS